MKPLGNTPPADHYASSLRPLPRRVPPLEYAPDTELRRVSGAGHIKWRGTTVFLGSALCGEYVGIRDTAEGEWTIAFGPLTLGVYSAHTLAFHEALAWVPDSR